MRLLSRLLHLLISTGLLIRQGKLLMVKKKTNNVFVKKKRERERRGEIVGRQFPVSAILDQNEITIYKRNYKYWNVDTTMTAHLKNNEN